MYRERRQEEARKTRLFTTLMVIAVFLIAGAVLLFNRNGFMAITEIKQEVDSLHRENIALDHEIDSLNNIILMLQTDSTYIEKRVREILGWGREGELIIRFTEPEN